MTVRLDEFRGRWVLITGASAGLGKQFAVQLGQAGARLLVCARHQERLTALADTLRESYGCEVRVVTCDLERPEGVAQVLTALRDSGIAVDILINNAGFGAAGRFVRTEAANVEAMTRLNCISLAQLTHALLPGMIERGVGGVIQVASVAAFVPTPYMAVYGATKAYVLSFTAALSEEMRGTGVKILALCPGPIPTEFQARAGYSAVATSQPGALTARAVVEQALRAYVRGRSLCIPGWFNPLQTALLRLLPWTWSTRLSGWVLRRSGRAG